MPSNKESPMLYMQGKLARQLFQTSSAIFSSSLDYSAALVKLPCIITSHEKRQNFYHMQSYFGTTLACTHVMEMMIITRSSLISTDWSLFVWFCFLHINFAFFNINFATSGKNLTFFYINL
ncbi:hypothetical protein OIU78_000905 [Salix suchowensis]|nr:hypothetical protein OIU78_000905 [Salix suchowensis]